MYLLSKINIAHALSPPNTSNRMADGIPKDYSVMFCEDSNKISASPNMNATINLPIPSTRGRAPYKTLDGSFVPPKHREQTVDLRQVVAKLENLPKENHSAYAMDTLNKHYSSVFVNRRKSNQVSRGGYKAYIQYHDEKDTYVVRVERNTLKAVRDKLPKRGNYRYFFKQLDNTCEEVESDESTVPFHEKDNSRQIYCQVFPY